ncbi:MAG: ribonuclease P protein component [Peptoniphilaceae bacterium]|nr:ribonuclease P protein component [Peptoniphilaceae bacterium]MDY6018908.1 ribonuclease P protein component [Anaerococcus sp.]
MEKQLSLRKNTDFERVYKKSKAFYNRDFTILIKNNGLDHPRFGFSISKKVGKANRRNKLKRRLREIIRHNYNNINNVDIIIIPKRHTVDYTYDQLKSSINHIFGLAKRKKRIRYGK